jgi:diacylglycerol kinase (ATP)
MRKQYLYIVNPVSGTGEGRKEVEKRLRSSLSDAEIMVWKTSGQDDVENIRHLCREKIWEAILVGGGDGTVNLVARELIGKKIPIGIIPMGTSNGLATCLGIDDEGEALSVIQSGKTVCADMIQVNEKISFHLCDFGFNANLIKRLKGQRKKGILNFFRSTLQEFLQMKPYRFSLQPIDGEQQELEANMLVVANGNKYGTGALINPESRIDDGLIEVIAINPDRFSDLVSLFIAMFRGTLHEIPKVKTWKTKELTVLNHDGAGFHVDGEYEGTVQNVHFKCIPRQVSFFSK